MKTTIFTMVMAVMMIFTTQTEGKTPGKASTIVLVHGAWLDASSWDKVTPALKAAGHEVIAVNLPAHGKDNTPLAGITLQSYVDAVKKAIGNRNNIVLVGHSMGGIVISEVAEQIPGQIGKLIYVGAFLPRNGESLMQLASKAENSESLLGKYLVPDEKTGSGLVAKDGMYETFFADVPSIFANKLIAGEKPDALSSFVTPATLTDANFGHVQKTYVYTVNDKAVAFNLQKDMARNANVTRTYGIPSSHTPFYSMPNVLSSIFLQESR